MHEASWRAPLYLFVLMAGLASRLHATCPCMIRYGVCDEAHQSDTVFVGTVESVAPPFLDPYSRAKVMADLPAGETARLQADGSGEALEKLKAVYLKMFIGIPDYVKSRIAEAKTSKELQAAFEEVQSEGRVARFRVRTYYKKPGDDDDATKSGPGQAFTSKVVDRAAEMRAIGVARGGPGGAGGSAVATGGAVRAEAKAGDDNEATQLLDIWTGSGDCGFDFQVGETYLVYAVEDEDSGKMETSVCMRTRRLSEEQGDLAYLYFLQNDEKESTRVEGFVSTSFEDQSLPRFENAVSAPAKGALLELDTGSGMRYTESDGEGRFYFDGLPSGEYRLSLLQPGFPQAARNVILSRGIHAGESACVRQILILPSRPATQLSQ